MRCDARNDTTEKSVEKWVHVYHQLYSSKSWNDKCVFPTIDVYILK